MQRKKYVASCVAREFSFLWIFYWVSAFFVFGTIIYLSFSSNGAILGLSNIKSTEQLESFFSHADSTGRLHADWVKATGLEVELTGKENKSFNFQVGGSYVETPSFTVSTYNKTYEIYLASLDDNLVIVLFGDILRKNRAGLQYCDVIEIYSDNIRGKQNLIDELANKAPDLFGQYKNVYVAKGDYPTNLLIPGAVILAAFLLVAAVLYGLPSLYPVQKFSYIGRQITKLAKAENRTFKEVCGRLNECNESALYRNGLEMLSGRYVVVMEKRNFFIFTQEIMNIFSLVGTYDVPHVQRITIKDAMYPDEMNDIQIVTDKGKYYLMTIHRTRQEVEEILSEMGFL